MEFLNPDAEPWPLDACADIHPRTTHHPAAVVACLHTAQDCPETGPNRILAFTPYLAGARLLRHVDMATAAPDEWEPGELTVRLFEIVPTAADRDDRRACAYVVISADASALNLSASVMQDAQAAGAWFDETVRDLAES